MQYGLVFDQARQVELTAANQGLLLEQCVDGNCRQFVFRVHEKEGFFCAQGQIQLASTPVAKHRQVGGHPQLQRRATLFVHAAFAAVAKRALDAHQALRKTRHIRDGNTAVDG